MPPKWRQVDAQARPRCARCRPGSAPGASPEALLPSAGPSATLERSRALLTLPAEEPGPDCGAGEGAPPASRSWLNAGCFVLAWGGFGAEAWVWFCTETGQHQIRSLMFLLGDAWEEQMTDVSFSEEKMLWRKTQEKRDLCLQRNPKDTSLTILLLALQQPLLELANLKFSCWISDLGAARPSGVLH